jgi:hypothetical protein
MDNVQNATARYFKHMEKLYAIISNYFYLRVLGGVVGWGTALQAEGRGFDSRFGQWEYFIYLIVTATL